MAKLKHAVTVTVWGSTITLPEGTRVHLVKGASGDLYAVSSIPLLQKLTGNAHDPVYRYCFVNHDDVAEE